MSSNKKIAAVVATAVVLSIGTVGAAQASGSKSTLVSVKQSSTKISVNAFGNSMAKHKGHDGHEAELRTVLAGLVIKGTITQAQSDAITVALAAALTSKRDMHDSDDVAKDARRLAHEVLIATTIGIDIATIKSRLVAGETLGAIAGVKRPALIAALVLEATKIIDAAVAAGKLSAEQAVALKANLTVRITAQVDSTHGAMGIFKGKKMGDFMGKKH